MRSSPAGSNFPRTTATILICRAAEIGYATRCAFGPIQSWTRREVYSRGNRVASSGATPGDQAGELRLRLRKQMLAHRGPDAVGADQRHRHFLLTRHPSALDHRQPLGVGGGVFELAAEPQLDIRDCR